MKNFTLLSLGILFLTACNSTTATALEPTPKTTQVPTVLVEPLSSVKNSNITIPSESSQLLVVTTDNWSTRHGSLQRYEKQNKKWTQVGEPIDIILGRNGLGWGKGLHATPKDATIIKREGDGKAPAGLFTLGHAFGYDETDFNMNFPYEVYKTTDHCVDDSNSKWYNTIVDSTKVAKDYKSFEHMKMQNHLYKYGITVNHNPEQIPMSGSCIFMHLKNKTGKGTAGCTAMKEDKIVSILKWLKEEKKPLLLQLPMEEMVNVDLR